MPTDACSANAKSNNIGKKKSLFVRRDLQICRVCQRGHSPDSNLIVFCDGCNDPYHQLCHSPPIGREYIEVAEAQWFCANCQNKIAVQEPLVTGMTGASLTAEEVDIISAHLHGVSFLILS